MALDKEEFLYVKFDGANCSIWKFHFQFFVEEKGLQDHFDGTKSLPDGIDVKKIKLWTTDDAKTGT